MRVLLSDGSGLTSRQCAALLGSAGHEVGVLAPSRVVLARGTRYVRRVHRVPRFGSDPMGWADAALAVLDSGRYDVLLPTQEQVTVLSLRVAEVIARGVATAVPPFRSLCRVQDKLAAAELLAELAIPRPAGAVVTSAEQLRDVRAPVYVKSAIGTASTGVHLATDVATLHRLADDFDQLDPAGLGGVLVQQPVAGPLLMVQALFDRGRLVAAHANTRDRAGIGNGATNKTSRSPAAIRPILERFGTALDWHGGLALDVIDTASGSVVIDVNPRLVEPGNAMAAGLDLVGTYLEIARASSPAARPDGHPGVRTHQLLLALVGAHRRRAVLAELGAAVTRTGRYRGSVEELTPVRRDPVAGASMAAVAALLLIRPDLRHHLAGGAVSGYALDAPSWRQLVQAMPPPGNRPAGKLAEYT
jgi:glutathione synthase/RimK-type ligase-like ATP-grasp enzyme